MNIPTIAAAEDILSTAALQSPGPWVLHCQVAAKTAMAIATRCGLDPHAAYVMGLLHDIGRREGKTGMRHATDGYHYLMGLGYPDIARICLTHSFSLQEIDTIFGELDFDESDYVFLNTFITSVVYDDYDRLIQLCDAICLPEGVVLMEKRMIDVSLRHGTPPFTVRKWQAYLGLKTYFDQKAGDDIYRLLDGIVENTFGWHERAL